MKNNTEPGPVQTEWAPTPEQVEQWAREPMPCLGSPQHEAQVWRRRLGVAALEATVEGLVAERNDYSAEVERLREAIREARADVLEAEAKHWRAMPLTFSAITRGAAEAFADSLDNRAAVERAAERGDK